MKARIAAKTPRRKRAFVEDAFLKSFEKRLVVIKSITKTIAISIENPPC